MTVAEGPPVVPDGGEGAGVQDADPVSALRRDLLPDSARTADDGWLTIGGISTAELAAKYGTPLFVYDEDHLRARCRETAAVFGEGNGIYATKAFLCRAMARLAHEEGLALDVATGGEMFVALSAGVPAERLELHGNNKSDEELVAAIEAGVGRIVVDSFDELDRIERIVGSGVRGPAGPGGADAGRGPAPKVLLRLNPGIEVHTHEHIQTGNLDSKFGFAVPTGDAEAAIGRASASRSIELVGLHFHIGSQVFNVENFLAGLDAIAPFVAAADLPELVVGGGLGVAYVAEDEAASITEWGRAILDRCAGLGIRSLVRVEPGRAIAASAAVTIYEIGTIKTIPGVRTYVAVDGGMSDNPRPILYDSGYEAFLPRSPFAARGREVRVVGKHCESGDVIVKDGRLPADVRVGDLLATPVTGAYGHSMGSNYNKIPRPPVVFVSDGVDRLVVRRETYEDLLTTDLG